ncbi:YacP-like NYN domain protein [Posidoniimonas corsicana]|uniref:YacP-like NYN domain protein n=1 Tax=Posidoniimonas corsicana TaxID=1938618 RepID=A0A5C5VEG6_9BACT|nr:NYN domain-containing protein [Posidoniimonas corsicana]TWT36062.1 YacP-like NYN domain protein [Posidoniimonas corsicana]
MARSPARVRLLIDGYNLLHATDVHGADALAGTLQGAREALLSFLASRLTKRERKRAVIVFDAAGAPPGLPDQYTYEGVHVLFARRYADADAMLEALIEADRAPKELLVVSGDRRVQRAARSRGAAWRDSSDWNRELLRRPAHPVSAPPVSTPEKPADIGDADYWVNEFSQPLPPDEAAPEPAPPARSGAGDPASESPASPPRGEKPDESSGNPFPPGYAEDLAAELEKPARRHPPRG